LLDRLFSMPAALTGFVLAVIGDVAGVESDRIGRAADAEDA
jgi:hypothetical protein